VLVVVAEVAGDSVVDDLGCRPHLVVTTFVPLARASIVTRPNGSGQWIGSSRAGADCSSPNLGSRSTSPTYSTSPPSSGSTSEWK
jgi:hypothetical protein